MEKNTQHAAINLDNLNGDIIETTCASLVKMVVAHINEQDLSAEEQAAAWSDMRDQFSEFAYKTLHTYGKAMKGALKEYMDVVKARPTQHDFYMLKECEEAYKFVCMVWRYVNGAKDRTDMLSLLNVISSAAAKHPAYKYPKVNGHDATNVITHTFLDPFYDTAFAVEDCIIELKKTI